MMSIILLHAITDRTWFENLIVWLKSRYRLLPIEAVHEYYAKGGWSQPSCHITVDDGDRTFADVIFPVLRKHEVPSTLFVSPKIALEGRNFWYQEITGYDESLLRSIAAQVLKVPVSVLSGFSPQVILKAMPICHINYVIDHYRKLTNTPYKDDRNLSLSVLQRIAVTGLVTIGAHTISHPILANEDDAGSASEVTDSIQILSALLDRRVEYFAYPNGIPEMDFGIREERILEDNGVRIAFTTESRHMAANDKAMRVPRIAISDGESISRVRKKFLLGSSWGRLQRLAGAGEYVQRKRLKNQLIARFR